LFALPYSFPFLFLFFPLLLPLPPLLSLPILIPLHPLLLLPLPLLLSSSSSSFFTLFLLPLLPSSFFLLPSSFSSSSSSCSSSSSSLNREEHFEIDKNWIRKIFEADYNKDNRDWYFKACFEKETKDFRTKFYNYMIQNEINLYFFDCFKAIVNKVI